eukprot:gene21247-8041_t
MCELCSLRYDTIARARNMDPPSLMEYVTCVLIRYDTIARAGP